MTRPSIIRAIAVKELRESFRDRKTLFLMIALPIILYPLMLLLFTQVAVTMQSKLEEKNSRVAYLGAEPTHPLVTFLAEDERLEVEPLTLEADGRGRGPQKLGEDIDLVVDLSQAPAELTVDGTSRLDLEFLSIEDSSRQAVERVEERLEVWTESEVERRLATYDISVEVIEPVTWELVDRSESSQRGGYALGMLLPILVVATVLLGAYYPAVDLTAGEKERGSIQTLFTAPISSFEIVSGKYFAVVAIAMVSGMANLLSLALIFGQNLFIGSAVFEDIDFSISPKTMAILFLNIVLIAFFFSALLLTVAVLARSYKEGQGYLGPVYIACIIPAAIAQMPGFELTTQLALVPAINVTLLMKAVMVGEATAEAIFLVVASTTVFTTLILVVAARLFAQEQVILGERGSLKLFARPDAHEAGRRPTIGQGLAWYGIALILLFYIGSVVQSRDPQIGLLVTLWVVILIPTLAFAAYFKLDLRETFNLRGPSARSMIAAVLLGTSAWVLVGVANAFIEKHVLHTPPELIEAMAGLFSQPQSALEWIWLLFIVALSPAICEEMLARGVLFSSLRQRVAPWALIVLTGLLFGLLHLNLFRLFGTTVLGLVMGLLVYKSGSIWTSVVFHALNNGTAIAAVAIFAGAWTTADTFPEWMIVTSALMTGAGLVLLGLERSPWAEAASDARTGGHR